MLNRNLWLSAIVGLVLLLPGTARAQVFLVSAGYYSSLADGTNAGTAYRYATNNTSGDLRLTLNLGGNIQSNAISYPLSLGNNNFTYSVASSFSPGPFGGLLLFFNSTGVSFNPNVGPVVADLAAATPTDSSGSYIIPAAGVGIRNYVDIVEPLAVPFTGDTVFNVGGFDVSITAFSSDTVPSGSFTLNVAAAAVPEPATWAMIALGCSSVVAAGWRFKKNRFRRRSK